MPTDPQNSVTLVWKNTQIVPRNGNDRWDLTGNGYTLTLRGLWCDRLINDGPANFTAVPELQFASLSARRAPQRFQHPRGR